MTTCITIYEDDCWAGSGTIEDGMIMDCPAVLGNSQDTSIVAYAVIEDAIANGETSVTLDGWTWTWEIRED